MDDNESDEKVSVNSIPLFVKKLWKMVNDKDAEKIISWNDTGDSFVIHDQLEFITRLLPQYFKHNNMASFVRQLNFYNFHKVPNVKDEIQFAHTCFLKDVPEILPFIRRKIPVLKQKTLTDIKDQEVQNLLEDIKNLKGKHSLVDKELNMLKQENAALWSELNSLRLKYTKQSTIINMLIHFLITYIHSHQSAFSKPNIQVSTSESSRNNIKVGPTLLEIDYKNNKNRSNPYTILEPGTSNSIMYSVKLPQNASEHKKPRKNAHTLEEMVATYPNLKRPKKPQRGLTYSIDLPGNQTEKLNKPEIQRSLLEILKENERLCEEDTDEIFTKLETECEHLTDIEDQQTTMEDNEIPENSNPYVISFPADVQDSINVEPILQSSDIEPFVQSSDVEPIVQSSDVEPIVQSSDVYEETVDSTPINFENIENVSSFLTAQTTEKPINATAAKNVISEEIPIETKAGTQKYTITYLKDPSSIKNKSSKKVEIVDHVFIKNPPTKTNGKPKFIKIPVKHLQHPLMPKKSTNLINVSSTQSKSEPIKPNVPKPTTLSVNPEGALLEILKENEKLTKDNIGESSLTNTQADNIKTLIESPSIGKNFVNFCMDGTNESIISTNNLNNKSEPIISKPTITLSKSKTKDKPYNILDNPKENLSMYVDNTQEEINMLQDILNNLTSKELSDILSTETPNIDLENIEHEGDNDESMTEYMNMDESVDKYFKSIF